MLNYLLKCNAYDNKALDSREIYARDTFAMFARIKSSIRYILSLIPLHPSYVFRVITKSVKILLIDLDLKIGDYLRFYNNTCNDGETGREEIKWRTTISDNRFSSNGSEASLRYRSTDFSIIKQGIGER